MQRALQTVLADRTAVIIAHRLSTVGIADRVLVLEHGRSSKTVPRPTSSVGWWPLRFTAPSLARFSRLSRKRSEFVPLPPEAGPQEIDERFRTGLDESVWTPAYLPAWSSAYASAATYAVDADGLHLSIAEQPDVPDLHG